MSFQLDQSSNAGPFETAAEALAAWSTDTTGIWLDDQALTYEELKYMAAHEVEAP